jgi:transposase InsO family protein
MAIRRRRPEPGLIFHLDRGSQYTASRLRKLPAAHGIRQSLSRSRQVWDNAVVEAFYSTLKAELIHRQAWRAGQRQDMRSSSSSGSSTTISVCTQASATARRPNMRVVKQLGLRLPHNPVVCQTGASSPWTRITLRALASSPCKGWFSRRRHSFSRSSGSTGGGPRGGENASNAPVSRCLRHSLISDVYSPSRRSSAPLPCLFSDSC